MIYKFKKKSLCDLFYFKRAILILIKCFNATRLALKTLQLFFFTYEFIKFNQTSLL